jgi:hypothetical protein
MFSFEANALLARARQLEAEVETDDPPTSRAKVRLLELDVDALSLRLARVRSRLAQREPRGPRVAAILGEACATPTMLSAKCAQLAREAEA